MGRHFTSKTLHTYIMINLDEVNICLNLPVLSLCPKAEYKWEKTMMTCSPFYSVCHLFRMVSSSAIWTGYLLLDAQSQSWQQVRKEEMHFKLSSGAILSMVSASSGKCSESGSVQVHKSQIIVDVALNISEPVDVCILGFLVNVRRVAFWTRNCSDTRCVCRQR